MTIHHEIDLDAADLDRMASVLEATDRFKILRRLEPRAHFHKPDCTPTRRAIYLDVETTGLDPEHDEIIELAMVPFDFSADGRIFAVHEAFDRFRDPGRPIPPPVTDLTGITGEMVAGRSIDPAEVDVFVSGASLVVAHNARFDRPFAEKLCGAFSRIAWACSWREVDWRGEGFTEGSKLSNLAAASGFFYDGHRAATDCRAGIELLSRKLRRSGRYGLDLLLESARQTRCRVWATRAPFGEKDALKDRGYRWSDGGGGRPRAWFIDVPEDGLEAEQRFLAGAIYRRPDPPLEIARLTARDRYSARG